MQVRKLFMVSFIGAIPPRTALQICSLVKYGYQVFSLSNHENRGSVSTDAVQHVKIRSRIFDWFENKRFVRQIRAPFSQMEYIVSAARKLDGLVSEKDIIQLNHPLLLFLCPKLKRKGCRIIYDAFEFYDLVYSDFGLSGRFFAWICNFAERLYLPKVDAIACVGSRNHWLRDRLAGLNPNTVELLNLPSIDTAASDEKLSSLIPADKGIKYIVYAGGLKPKKGIESFSEIVRRVKASRPDTHFLIIGNILCGKSASEWLSDEGISEKCTHIPWLPMSDLSTLLQHNHIGLVLMSPKKAYLALGQGGGRKLFTYMAAGLPVIAPDFGTAWDMVTNHEIGRQVDTTNPGAVADALILLLEDEDMRNRMSRRAIGLFKSDFYWEKIENAYISLLSNCRY